MSLSKQGYVKTKNEWRLENIRLTGTLSGSGNQLFINKPNNGPVLSIGGNQNYINDLLLVEHPLVGNILRINAQGEIYIRGNLHESTIPISEDNSILYTHNQKVKGNSDQLCWDQDINYLGIGTAYPDSKLTITGGNININDGHIKINTEKVLDRNKLLLSLIQGAGDPEEGIFMGDPGKNGSWRIVLLAGDIHFQKRIDGGWVTRQHIN